ncbi:DUF3429 domain-containing protein [Methylobacterium nonmethylotrophicum]|uniref:DUF3429 domain-containing protein n=1 Tax=Methylobacterium nonmethylotrophicum TaxID=1141884 RepID=A0A4Z0NQH4_9HYPH|nr:DUF3429 domain-containing protein [Methylobacterium nonmethylotrophicum]TGD99283.1 DUF3429 domain-containing protein [Methylobacterium nonmethylotrophicum]
MQDDATGRTLTVHEPRAVPWLSVALGFGPMLPFVAGALAAWVLGGDLGRIAVTLTLLWGAAILLFFSGVRRGVSFRTEGGATAAQIATMIALFVLGLGAVLAVALVREAAAALLLIAGFVLVAVLDPIAARRGEAPLFFARLRPIQMPIAVVSLVALLACL